MTEEQIRQFIRDELASIIKIDRFIFDKNIQIFDNRNIQIGRTNGTKIGTATDQKLSVYGVLPIIQQGAISLGGTAGVLGHDDNARSAINSIIAVLKNFGITA